MIYTKPVLLNLKRFRQIIFDCHQGTIDLENCIPGGVASLNCNGNGSTADVNGDCTSNGTVASYTCDTNGVSAETYVCTSTGSGQ